MPEQTKTTISSRAKSLFVLHLGCNPEKITDEARLEYDLGADSLDMVELSMAFEEEFGIIIPDSEAEKIETVGQAIKYVEGKLQNAK